MGLFDFLFRKKPSIPTAPVAVSANRLKELSAKIPFPLHAVAGARVEAELLRLRKELKGTGTCPVIVGNLAEADRLFDLWEEPYDFDRQLTLAERAVPEVWFEERADEDAEACNGEDQNVVHEYGAATITQLQIGLDHHNRPHAEVLIAVIPTEDKTMIPLHLRFGDWNACPSPHVHTMLARYWRDKYGAEIATLAADIIEYTVERPPETEAEARELAMQQFLYCSDIVYQGVGSVATLAKALRHSTRWYFWWD